MLLSEPPELTWVRHVEPGRVLHGVQADVGPRRVAVLVGLGGEDVEDGEQEADQPGAAHPEQGLPSGTEEGKRRSHTQRALPPHTAFKTGEPGCD